MSGNTISHSNLKTENLSYIKKKTMGDTNPSSNNPKKRKKKDLELMRARNKSLKDSLIKSKLPKALLKALNDSTLNGFELRIKCRRNLYGYSYNIDVIKMLYSQKDIKSIRP